MTDSIVIALSTCPDEDCAARIAAALVSERLAACVTRVNGARSTYFWDGRLQQDTEILLIIKTTASRLAELESRLKALHPYAVPELVAAEAVGGSGKYLEWVRASVASKGE